MNLKKLFTNDPLKVAFTLSLVWLLAIWHFRFVNAFVYPILAIATVTAFDVSITWLRDKKTYLPFSSLVTGFLIGLIIEPTVPFWVIIVAAAAASASKQFIAVGRRQHIFNPASFGILTASLALGTPVAWWAVSWGYLPLIILIPLMLKILWHMKRLFLPLGFLLVYFAYLALTDSSQSALQIVTSGSTILFAFVMVPEPITSPIKGHLKYLFGVMVAISVIVLSLLQLNIDIFLPALLITNLAGFLLIRWQFVK